MYAGSLMRGRYNRVPNAPPSPPGCVVTMPPVPRRVARAASALVLLAWATNMAVLARRAWSSSGVTLAADLAGYTPAAQWRGIYYRNEKIGFSVGQTTPVDGGYEMREDGRLQMMLLGATTAVRLHGRARVDREFRLQEFSFSLDPGSGATEVSGALAGRRLSLKVRTPSGERSEVRDLPEPPALALNLPRALAAHGLVPGEERTVSVFDPLTTSNVPMTLRVGPREVVRAAGRPVPAFVVESRYAGITTRSWITDVGEVVREESPMGLLTVRETPEQAQALAVPGAIQSDLLQASAVSPSRPLRIDDPTTVTRLRLRLSPLDGFDRAQIDGDGQSLRDDVIEVRDPRDLPAGPTPGGLDRYLRAEPFLEKDDPAIQAEARKAIAGATDARLRAERLVRYVHALLEKRPTVSLPSAREVLRTRVGDCNEHTALYVAMARAASLPARIATGLVQLRGAFYYHAWPEVFVAEPAGDRGRWLPVDPTLDQFPADATHVRLARGGLEQQAAILSLVGRARLDVLDVAQRPGANPVLVGRPSTDLRPMELALPRRDSGGCWSSPARGGR
jgi:transglutaminase-like putative cysteine protease